VRHPESAGRQPAEVGVRAVQARPAAGNGPDSHLGVHRGCRLVVGGIAWYTGLMDGPGPLRVAIVQFDIAWENAAANVAAVSELLRASPPQPGGLIVLPEMFASGFSMNVEAAVDRDGVAQRAAAGWARDYQSHVLAGIATPGGRGRNRAFLYAPDGSEVASYHKIHPFFNEARHYDAGRDVVVVDLPGARFAPLICYDLRFPETFRATVSRGAEVIAVIANWPEARHEHWTTLLRARAIENQAYVIGVNRVGRDPTPLKYRGGSIVVDPKGVVIADAGDAACVVHATLDLVALRAWRRDFPVLADIR
jgi:predicted amidohydrolase